LEETYHYTSEHEPRDDEIKMETELEEQINTPLNKGTCKKFK